MIKKKIYEITSLHEKIANYLSIRQLVSAKREKQGNISFSTSHDASQAISNDKKTNVPAFAGKMGTQG
jgi:hypothetical protein